MLNKLKKSNSEGFTIIEVMIVLAIAGLILLIVFLAIPALQRNSRNTQRKNDAAAYAAAVSEDVNNNNGVIPATAGAATSNVAAGQLTTRDYAIASPMTALPGTLVDGTVYIRNSSTCAAGGGGRLSTAGGSARAVTITYLIESPGAAAVAPSPAGFVAQCTTAQ
jgi:prepilin-type N-terminal cleavage/methylation domain-containing protein